MSSKDTYKGRTLSQLYSGLIPKNLCSKHQHSSKLSGMLLLGIHLELYRELKNRVSKDKSLELPECIKSLYNTM